MQRVENLGRSALVAMLLGVLLQAGAAESAPAPGTRRTAPPQLYVAGVANINYRDVKGSGAYFLLPFGKTLKVPAGSAALVLLPGDRALTMVPGKQLNGELALGPEPAEGSPMTFTLRSGVLAFDIRFNLQDPDGIRLIVGSSQVRLAHGRGMVRVDGTNMAVALRNGSATITAANGLQPFALAPDQTVEWVLGAAPAAARSIQWPAHLSTFALDDAATAVVTRVLAARPWDSGSGSGILAFLVYAGLVIYLGRVVQPHTGGKGAAPFIAFVVLESQLSLSRLWLCLAGIWIPLGALGLGLLIAMWCYREARHRRESLKPGPAILQHLLRYLGLFAASNAASEGLRFFSLVGPGSFLTNLCTVIDPAAASLIARQVPTVPDAFLWELAAAVIALILYRATE